MPRSGRTRLPHQFSTLSLSAGLVWFVLLILPAWQCRELLGGLAIVAVVLAVAGMAGL